MITTTETTNYGRKTHTADDGVLSVWFGSIWNFFLLCALWLFCCCCNRNVSSCVHIHVMSLPKMLLLFDSLTRSCSRSLSLSVSRSFSFTVFLHTRSMCILHTATHAYGGQTTRTDIFYIVRLIFFFLPMIYFSTFGMNEPNERATDDDGNNNNYKNNTRETGKKTDTHHQQQQRRQINEHK